MISLDSTRVAGGRAGLRQQVSQRGSSSRVETYKGDSQKLFLGFGNFSRQLEDRRHVGIFRTSDVEIFDSFGQAVCDRERASFAMSMRSELQYSERQSAMAVKLDWYASNGTVGIYDRRELLRAQVPW